MGRKQKKLKENNPWERSCNSEKVHLLLSMDGKHTVRWNMKKKDHVGHFSSQHLSVKLTIMYFG